MQACRRSAAGPALHLLPCTRCSPDSSTVTYGRPCCSNSFFSCSRMRGLPCSQEGVAGMGRVRGWVQNGCLEKAAAAQLAPSSCSCHAVRAPALQTHLAAQRAQHQPPALRPSGRLNCRSPCCLLAQGRWVMTRASTRGQLHKLCPCKWTCSQYAQLKQHLLALVAQGHAQQLCAPAQTCMPSWSYRSRVSWRGYGSYLTGRGGRCSSRLVVLRRGCQSMADDCTGGS